MSEGSEEQFLIEGIKRYAQAQGTLTAFETMMGDRLCEIAKQYKSKEFTPKKPPTPGNRSGPWGHAIWTAQEGSLRSRKGAAWLELGFWWNEGVVASYCGFVDADDKSIDFNYDRNNDRIEFRKWSKKARLFMIANPAASLDDELKFLLDELMASIA